MPTKHTPDFIIVGYIVFVCALFGACKKNISSTITDVTPTNFSQVFDEFWNDMDINYVYWDIDTTNWNAMYNRYKPLFAQLDLQDNNDVQKSVGYFRQMVDGLIDSHYSIGFISTSIAAMSVFPALDRKERLGNFHSPFLYLSVDSSYFDKGYTYGEYVTLDNERMSATCATIQNKVLYFNCNQFALQEAYLSTTNNGVKTTLQYFFDQLQSLPQNIKGMIIDVRNNHGGNLVDLDFLVGRFINKPLHFGYTHYKSGNGRLAFTPWIDATIQPQSAGKALNIPIIVLADEYSISLSEAVTMAIHTLPNGSFVGETTWGATGPIADNVLYDDGQFNVPNFLSVYTSSGAFKYIDGKIYEGKGFPPDVFVPYNLTALQTGDDLQLDKAISLVK
jgi:hypothetical protein